MLVDAIALRRGYAAPGETCEIPGVGPISVAWARQLMGDGPVDILVHDGVDILTYASTTRYTPRPIKVAIAVRDRTCTVPGCTAEVQLERDHLDDYTATHDTSYRNLHHFCPTDHDDKTHHGARIERDGPDWIWHPPPNPDGTRPPPTRAPVGQHLTGWNTDDLPDGDVRADAADDRDTTTTGGEPAGAPSCGPTGSDGEEPMPRLDLGPPG